MTELNSLKLSKLECQQMDPEAISPERPLEDIPLFTIGKVVEPFILDIHQVTLDLIQGPKLDHRSMSCSLLLSTCETLRGNVSDKVFDEKARLFS